VHARLTPEFQVIKERLLARKEQDVSEPAVQRTRPGADLLQMLKKELVFLQGDREKTAGPQFKLGSEYIAWLREAAPAKYTPDPTISDMPVFKMKFKPTERVE
jgi:hypothetical protein